MPIVTPMTGRTIAIGDIHGCAPALAGLLAAVEPRPQDTVITLGDHIDRGPDTRGVIDTLIGLAARCRVVSVLGNHEEMLLSALAGDPDGLRMWLACGGAEVLPSYGWREGGPTRALIDWLPPAHRRFLAGCVPYHETETHIFAHAHPLADAAMIDQPPEALRWRKADAASAAPHVSGKTVVVGHTPQRSARVLDLGFLKVIDTNCARGGRLTALDVNAGTIWQVNPAGSVVDPDPPHAGEERLRG